MRLARRILPTLCAALLLGAGAMLPPVPGKRVITLTPTPGFYSEPSIAIDPLHPARVLAAYQTAGRVAYTRDAGRTWHAAQAVPLHDYKLTDGDVSVAYDRADARCFATSHSIVSARKSTGRTTPHATASSSVRSPDGGAHWERRAIAWTPSRPSRLFEDKPSIVVDDTHSRYQRNVLHRMDAIRTRPIDAALLALDRRRSDVVAAAQDRRHGWIAARR